ncbi:lamin tail domain-containing protein [Luteolibacter yonseiensis]|uniref:Lamin tail domain-containing protein n=1 Tax=Luteolibacter yonseiensis TaxID=1144680 RepID=A0A934R7D2_9BACT|nr:lamin tail domain-containing protein [Luteolibacter yonseiensis]MBK1817303.1 lamin tail domain-containing protein [Luteolibacter yonseiensis]
MISPLFTRCCLLAFVSGFSFSGPAAAANPKAWFKADSINAADGAAVVLWADSSHSGNLAQAGSNAPTLATSGMNGFPAVRFSGSQLMMFPRPVQDDFTIMILFKTPGGAGGSDSFYAGSGLVSGERPGVVNDFGMSIRNNGRILAGTGNPDVTLRSDSGPAVNYGNNAPHVATFTRRRSTGALELVVDRMVRGTGTSGTQSLNVYPQLCIGAHPGPVGPYLNGDIAEIIIFDTALTSGEVVANEDALRGKYALSNGTAPSAPQNPSANGARLKWNEAIGAKSYKVYRASSAAGPFTMIAQNLTASEYTDPSPTGGQPNFYQIVATNSVGNSAASATVEGILPPLPANGPVIINEIHYNGLDNSVHSDFVELYNFSTTAANIGGWTLSDGIEYTFPAGTVIPPGGYVVVAEDPATVQVLWGVTALGPYAKSLSSDGEALTLKNSGGTVVAEVTYSSGFPWPCAANGDGASMELVNPSLDAKKGSSWRSSVAPTAELTGEVASPGAQNHQFSLNAAPNIEQVSHLPLQPAANTPITVTARLSDSNGVAGAQLSYQIVAPGNFIPAYLPIPIVSHNIDTSQPRPANPAFEDPANWTNVIMLDNGTNGDAVSGDGVYTAVIPGQAHRSLVRYRVTATDSLGASARAPFADDESKNFAAFVYNGVPDYQGIPASTLKTLPVYQFLTRKADYDQCVAYNSADQLTGNTPGWTYENWEATMVFDGVVYDHIKFRLHGGNGRYKFTSKRGLRFFFNKGYDFQNRDNDGELSPTKWNSITAENCWENRETLTYCLNEVVNFYLWRKLGIPAPRSNWGHFRTITTAAEQSDAYHGDFWGLIMIHEDYDSNFIDSHELEKGNIYKLTRDATDGASQQRYQAADAVSDGSDHQNIFANLTQDKDAAFVNRYVNFKKWSTYHALCQAVRHYDYWPTGDNNAAYYFQPDHTDQTDRLGKLWIMPNDVDATWGPTWNEGKDVVYSAVFDGATPLTSLYPTYFNSIREVRDLLWQPDQINPLLDQFAAVIAPFIPADTIRWKGGPNEAGNYNGIGGAGNVSLAALVADMKKFAWTGGEWPGDNSPVISRAAFMDNLQLGVSNSEGSAMPVTPTLNYQGPAGYPTNTLTFGTTAFADPQGTADFAAIQWRVAEITDPTAPAYDPTKKVKLEWEAAFESAPLPAFSSTYTFPGNVCKTGRAYRARVRHQDKTGRWSHWSAPVKFIAGENTGDLPIVISEFLYKPSNATPSEVAAGFNDGKMFEYLEVRNVGQSNVDLSGCYFDKGITFTFPPDSVLAPGASTLVVANPAAFAFRFGGGRPIAGMNTGSLANEGERLLLLAANTAAPLIDFTYKLSGGSWPAEADTDGVSLVLVDPESRPDPKLAVNWRASRRAGGAPGFADDTDFNRWKTDNSVTGGPEDDDDSDGIPNSLEYALLTNPHSPNAFPSGRLQPLTVSDQQADYLTITFRRLVDAGDIDYHVVYSENLGNWGETPVRTSITDHFDGSVTETWRAPVSVGNGGFLRISITPR